MRKLSFVPLLLVLLVPCAPSTFADHLDVIDVSLRPDCSLPEYLAIVREFNAWGKPFGYQTEIAMPLHSSDLAKLTWIGRSANAAAFGKAWDAWRDGQADPTSTPAKLNARFEECTDPLSRRRSFDTYR